MNKYLKNLSQEEFETLDKTIQNVYFARIEASRIKEQYGCETTTWFCKKLQRLILSQPTAILEFMD